MDVFYLLFIMVKSPSLLDILEGSEESITEGFPVLGGHDVVYNGVDGGGDVEKHASGVEQLLVELVVELVWDELHLVLHVEGVEEALSVVWRPAHEERDHHYGCKGILTIYFMKI